jgi:hypothetical protein
MLLQGAPLLNFIGEEDIRSQHLTAFYYSLHDSPINVFFTSRLTMQVD